MASLTPSPQSSPSVVPPATNSNSSPRPFSISTPPPLPSSTSAPSPKSSPPLRSPATPSPMSQPNVNPPETSNSTNSPPPQSPPPAATSSLPPAPTAFPPQQLTVGSQPPSSRTSPPPNGQPPQNSTPPPSPNVPPPSSSKPSESPPPPRSQSSSPPSPSPPVRSPPPTISKPPESSPPPPSSKAPESSPSPPSSKAPESSPSPPSSKPPQSSPPPPSSKPPKSSPPPSPSKIPKTSPPTPSSKPPNSSSPPLASLPPQGSSPPSSASITPKSSPTPSASTDPKNSPPPSSSLPPKNAPLPPRHTPPAPPSSHLTPSPGSSPPKSSPTLPLKPPTTPPTARSPPSSSSGNRSSNDSITDVPGTSHSNNNGGIDTRALVAIAVATSIIVIGFLGLAVWWLRHRRKRVPRPGGLVMPSPPGTSQRIDSPAMKAHFSAPLIGNGGCSESASSPKDPGGMGNSRSWFTFDELANATNGFSTQNLLGEGGFGSVYKGHLPDGREVAVKQLKIGGGQGEREFKAEVEIISRIHHRHLVSLVGYCISDNRRLLVYEYVPNKTLYHHLHGEGRPVLDWKTRVKVAVGAARGIAYLHEDCHPRVFHRDIKSSNILLDENFEARVSDFGLAKLALDANSHVSTRVIGTFGYVAPEYASSGKLTEKSDVYSFGVVLLELITGRKPVDASQPLGDESLVEWARPLLSNALDNEEFEGLADPRLEKKYVESEMFRMIEVAAACVRHSAAKRPRMGQVVRAFDSLATSDLSNGMRVGQSEIYDSAQQSAEIRLFRRMAFGSQNYSTDFFSQVS